MTDASRRRSTPLPPTPPRDLIIAKARSVVRGYAAGREHWNVAAGHSALLRQMSREYEGRFLYELIQNAYDAHPADLMGSIAVLLDLDEAEHGVLYVANTGTPFNDANFDAICALAQSDKAPDQSIGNKGVGFKSVLQVCNWPEIYSAGSVEQDHFDGYCFTFARPSQYLDLADGDQVLAEAMREEVSPYFLPTPLDTQPARVVAMARDGFSTVIRLPLKSAGAGAVAVDRISQILDEEVPVQMFLERLRRLEITTVEEGRVSSTRTLERHSAAVRDPVEDTNQRFENVSLGEQGEWFVSSRRMSANAMQDAIAESIAEGQLDASWASWSQDSWISVAVRTDGHDIQPRLYTFLPMERGAAAPLYGHVHAPFSTMLARTSVSEQVILNARLLDCAARAATAAVHTFREDPSVLPDTALVDLLAWNEDHHERVTQSFAEVEVDTEHAEVVPIEPLSDGRRRAAFSTAYSWDYEGLSLLDRARLARDAGAELVSSVIEGARLERLEAYCRAFFDVGLAPDANTRAIWVELAASHLHSRRVNAQTWDRFYAELVEAFSGEPDALRGRVILLGDDGVLYAPPSEDSSDPQPVMFFPPAVERTDEEDEVEADVVLTPPASLRRSLILMHGDLRWTYQDGSTRRHTPARRFLEDSRLVRRFSTADLLELIGRALASSKSAELSRDALSFTYNLSRAARSVRPRDLATLNLRVPTREGWRAAGRATFSPGWQTPLSAPLAELIELASGQSSDLAELGMSLLREPEDWPVRIRNRERDEWRAFLSVLGVRDGLWPRLVTRGTDVYRGSAVRPELLVGRLGLSDVDAARWEAAVTADPDWNLGHPNTAYHSRAGVAVLPAQADYETFDQHARVHFADLVVAGLQRWPDTTFQVGWYQSRHPGWPDEAIWPSPLATFLRETSWLPVSAPGHRRDESFVRPSEAWHFSESDGEESPHFSPLVVARIRRPLSASAPTLARLRALGAGDWMNAADAPRLLRHLADLVERDALGETGVLAFRRSYEDAWARAAERETDEFLDEAGDLPVVATRAGVLGTIRPSDVIDAVYLLGDSRSLAARVLGANNFPIVRIERSDEKRVRPLLEGLFGDRLITESNLSITVVTDHGDFRADGSGRLLLDNGRSWLRDLVALVLETKRSHAGQPGPKRRQEVADRLERIRCVETALLELHVQGVPLDVPERHRYVVPIDDDQFPTLIIATDMLEARSDLDELIALMRPLCELLRIAPYEDPLLLALERLHARGVGSPTDEDFAVVLEMDQAEIAEVRLHVASSMETPIRLLVPWVAYQVDARTALALFDARDSIATEHDLRQVVGELAPEMPTLEPALAAARSCDSLPSFRDTLKLDYRRFNQSLSELSPLYEPLRNEPGHAQAMANYRQRNHSHLLDELRARFLSTFEAGAPLDAYVAARGLEITPDPAWLDEYELPPEDAMLKRTEVWLAQQGVRPEATSLPQIDRTRADNRRRLTDAAEAASSLVPAWTHTTRALLPPIWLDDAPVAHILAAAGELGFLDFVLLDEAAVLARFAANGWWPADMPQTLDPDALGLSESEVSSQGDAAMRDRQERLRKRRLILLDDVEFSTEPSKLAAIVEHLRANIRDETLAAATRPVRLRDMEQARTVTTSGGLPGSGVGGAPRWQGETMSQAQKTAVGLAGETIAFAWLQQHYPEVCTPASWVSRYREIIGDPTGDDSLGYDFAIALRQTSLFFEVKATTGTDPRFDLGQSEVRKAAECARRRRDDYRIIFVTNVLDSENARIHILRNPLDPENRRFYRFPGSGLVCTFSIDR